jgi:hypothetical protein
LLPCWCGAHACMHMNAFLCMQQRRSCPSRRSTFTSACSTTSCSTPASDPSTPTSSPSSSSADSTGPKGASAQQRLCCRSARTYACACTHQFSPCACKPFGGFFCNLLLGNELRFRYPLLAPSLARRIPYVIEAFRLLAERMKDDMRCVALLRAFSISNCSRSNARACENHAPLSFFFFFFLRSGTLSLSLPMHVRAHAHAYAFECN